MTPHVPPAASATTWQQVKPTDRRMRGRPCTAPSGPLPPLARCLAQWPNELIDMVVALLDDTALLAVAAPAPPSHVLFSSASQAAQRRYGRGAPVVYAHRPLPQDAFGRAVMWPALYAEQCRLRARLGSEAPTPDASTLQVAFTMELTMLLPLFGAHHVSSAGQGQTSMLGPWLGTLYDDARPAGWAEGQACQALLHLSLMPDVFRTSRLFHMQAAGALVRAGRSDDACAAYLQAHTSRSAPRLALGLFEASAVGPEHVVQHMLTCAVVCNDAVVWQAAMRMPEAQACLGRSEAHLLDIARRLAHDGMREAILRARATRRMAEF